MDDEMNVTAVRGHRWDGLIDHLVERLRATLDGPFATARIVVSSPSTGRLVGQAIAERMGISAGISYLSPSALMRDLSVAAGIGQERARWTGTPLTLAVADSLNEVAAGHPVLERSLRSDDDRPARRLATAARLATLFRTYLDASPELVATWLEGSDAMPGGEPLPEHLAWQPELLRTSVENLEVDPLDLLEQLEEAALTDPTPTFILGVDEFTAPQMRVVRTLSRGTGIVTLHPFGTTGATWAAGLATNVVDLPGQPLPAPSVDLHDSHGDSRQVEVLRDEITRAFLDDATLEPRDVIIVTPQPHRFASLIEAAFADTGRDGHPGRQLRVQAPSEGTVNPVLELALHLLRLPDLRASASDLLALLLSTPIAHRWGFDDRHGLTELVAGAGIRWGLDGAHREAFGLGDVRQNTWVRGIDRLLIALASSPADDIGLDVSGAEAVNSSDLQTIGSLAEVLSRLRRFVGEIATSTTVGQWCTRLRGTLESLIRLPRDDEWQAWQAQATLAKLESEHAGRTLSRQEFLLLFGEAVEPWRARVAAGNGALHVVPLGELLHVPHRVVALLGVTDDVVPGRSRIPADSVDLDGALPDQADRRLRQLLTHARSAERLIIVRQAKSQRTNDDTATPVAIEWLLGQLEVAPTPVAHAPMASSPDNFRGEPSFDEAAYRGAKARSMPPLPDPTLCNRLDARSRPLGAPPTQVTLEQLVTFLQDPAKAFLRGPGGITLYSEPRVTDEISLQADSLIHWGIVNTLVTSLQQGTPVEQIETAVSRREQLPPAALGRVAFNKAKDETESLWREAGADWGAEVEDHSIDLLISLTHPLLRCDISLVGATRTRGGAVVEVTPSQGRDKIIKPWIESLALAAAGQPVEARLHQLGKHYSDVYGISTTISPLGPADAAEHLAVLLAAYALGQHRLIPVPAAPAITYAKEHHTGKFNAARWKNSPADWKNHYWPNRGNAWPLFYDGHPSELLEGELIDLSDPPVADGPFQAWAQAIYLPLARSIR